MGRRRGLKRLEVNSNEAPSHSSSLQTATRHFFANLKAHRYGLDLKLSTYLPLSVSSIDHLAALKIEETSSESVELARPSFLPSPHLLSSPPQSPLSHRLPSWSTCPLSDLLPSIDPSPGISFSPSSERPTSRRWRLSVDSRSTSSSLQVRSFTETSKSTRSRS